MFPFYTFKEQYAPEVNKETNTRRRTFIRGSRNTFCNGVLETQ
jgi:hypothetical protein